MAPPPSLTRTDTTFRPAGNLTNRTFIGLIIAQFLAGFNDQAIHASAMFYAIHSARILPEAAAITVMPILFYAPWAIFCTLAGYLGDRYSKTYSLIAWKGAEVLISLVLLAGFLVGGNVGAWMVMSCVFLMGTHAAFFAPAKYGAMPEILQPHVLSRGNGILESTTFLAAILGTVAGGLLYKTFKGQEEWLGIVLLVLSVIGAGASLLIAPLPPANPSRPFPTNLVRPLLDNLRTLFRARPLALSVLGIAFFIFMVSYMRAAVYMHGETRNPRWEEDRTSLIVATVALGVGLGSPLAGFLSGGKVELGMVPVGCLGMMLATTGAALAIEHNLALVAALIVIGFFSGFYMVPLYTLLQHRAPKQSKADLIATSNFINVTGAISASLLFGALVFVSQATGFTPKLDVKDVASGKVVKVFRGLDKKGNERTHGSPVAVTIETENKRVEAFGPPLLEAPIGEDPADYLWSALENEEPTPQLLEVQASSVEEGDEVTIARYDLRDVVHYVVRRAGEPRKPAYDKENLPRYLFLGAGLMTLAILVLLVRLLPDFFVRTLFWLRSQRRYKIRVVGMQYLPTRGPVILATNAHTFDGSMQLIAATDRSTRVLLLEEGPLQNGKGLLRALARRTSLIELHEANLHPEALERARAVALRTLTQGHLLAVSIDSIQHTAEIEALLTELHRVSGAPVVPVFVGPLHPERVQTPLAIRVVFGEALPVPPPLPETRKTIHHLAERIRQHDGDDAPAH